MRSIYEKRPRKEYEKRPTKEMCIREKTPIDSLSVFLLKRESCRWSSDAPEVSNEINE